MKKYQLGIIILLLALSIVDLLFFEGVVIFGNVFKISTAPFLYMAIGFLALILLYIMLLLIFKKSNPELYKKMYDFIFEDEEAETFDGDKYINDLRNKIVHYSDNDNMVKENNKDILELMLENMKEIRDYYVISKKQANRAFSLSVYMCIIGFVLIAFSISLMFFSDLGLGVTLIPAVGGAIAELIAGTALFVYKTSLVQLNNYYRSLHNNERFLSLVNLVSKINPEKQDEVYINIINTELQNYRNC